MAFRSKALYLSRCCLSFLVRFLRSVKGPLMAVPQRAFSMSTAELIFGVLFFTSITMLLLILVRTELGSLLFEILNGDFRQWRIWNWDSFWAERNHSEGIRNATLALAGLAGALAGLYNLFNATRRTRVLFSQAEISARQETNERYFEAMKLLTKGDPISRAGGVHLLTAIAEEQPGYAEGAIRNIEFFVKQCSAQRKEASTLPVDLGEAIKALHKLQYKIKNA